MKITRRILSAALAGLLVLALAACSPAADGLPTDAPGTQAPGGSPEATAPVEEATPAPTPAAGTQESGTGEVVPRDPDGTVSLVETEDVPQKLLGIPRDTVLLTVNGTPVTAEDYLYCLAFSTENVAGEHLDHLDWNQMVTEDRSIQDYIIDSAVETVVFYTIIRSKAAELGVTVSEEERAELDEYIGEVIASLGSAEEYGKRLQMLGISDRGFRALNEVSVLYDGVEAKLFGDKLPGEDVLAAWAEETADALRAKHILIKTVDDNNLPLPGEEAAAAKAKAEDILAQLRAAADPIALFDELMNEHSEDGRDASGALYSKDGYLFGPDEMVEEFEAGTRALKYNEISGLVQTSYGYHIILRLPPVTDEVRAAWISDQMNRQVSEWVYSAEAELTEEIARVTPRLYYEALTAYRTELILPAG